MDVNDLTGHFRIGIFDHRNYSKGIGYCATRALLAFAFEDLALGVVALEVFPFNKKAIALYKKWGFSLVECIEDNEAEDPYRYINAMELTKKDYLNVIARLPSI